MKADEIQVYLRKKFKRDRMNISNMYVFGEESDFLTFSYKDQTHEFEVKVSRNDFKADFKKSKHEYFEQVLSGNVTYMQYKKERDRRDEIPNRFSFVVPYGLIKRTEVPNYAGLYYVCPNGEIICHKKSKLIHGHKFNRWRSLSLKLFYKTKKKQL